MIIAYVGDVGSGKTLNMVWDCMNAIYRHKHVISNTPIDCIYDPILRKKRRIRAEFISSGNGFLKALAYRENCIFALDEAAVYLPNYFWNKLPTELIVKFAQNRKYNTDIWYTTQGYGMAVSRLRELTQVIYKCRPTKVLFQRCYLRERFNPAYFKGEQTWKKREKYFRGSRILYPSQLRRIFKAYDTHFVVDASATMKVSGFQQPTWNKTTLQRPTTNPQTNDSVMPVKRPAIKKSIIDTVKPDNEIKKIVLDTGSDNEDFISYPHELDSGGHLINEQIKDLLQKTNKPSISDNSLPGSDY